MNQPMEAMVLMDRRKLKHRFTYDVTDFQHLLKDSLKLMLFIQGGRAALA